MRLPRTVPAVAISRELLATTIRTLLIVVVAMTTTAPAIAAPASQPPAAAPTDRSTPRVDPHDPQGAWAGYSVDGAPSSRSPRNAPAGATTGMDVSGHQGKVDWPKAWADGARFTYVKATEGTGFRSDTFDRQYHGSRAVGMVRGAYHFALPDRSSGAEQAHYFVDHGGGWLPGGHTLPGALDIEHNPYGEVCYGLDPARMSQWIADFSNTYHARTGRFPAIYTTAKWWDRCTGANPDFGVNNPLWVARYNDEIGALPAGWDFHTIWQYDNKGVFPGDQNAFNGNEDQLAQFAG